MTDSKMTKEILELLNDANPAIETGAAAVGLLTEYMKTVNEKIPLKDLLMEVGKFVKTEVLPPLDAAESVLFQGREKSAKAWVKVFKAACEEAGDLPEYDHIALQITLQMMRSSGEVWSNAFKNANANQNKK